MFSVERKRKRHTQKSGSLSGRTTMVWVPPPLDLSDFTFFSAWKWSKMDRILTYKFSVEFKLEYIKFSNTRT